VLCSYRRDVRSNDESKNVAKPDGIENISGFLLLAKYGGKIIRPFTVVAVPASDIKDEKSRDVYCSPWM
jgi:hypothetical protein